MTQFAAQPAADQPALPAGALLAWVGGACAGVSVLTALAVSALDLPDGWRIWSAATLALLVSAAASLPLLIAAGRVVRVGDDPKAVADRLPKAAALIVLAGVTRALVTGVAVLLMVQGARLATWPSFALTGLGYLALLATEAVVTGRAFWAFDAKPRGPAVGAG